ncbi:NAD-dependent epimerase/dehydratase family protein [Candidatus Nitrosotenuis cloacae]|uniref:UDP-glucose 4-epimerase n=1 Tax=Candidatus Nitrosotenuis cloacae TaxID=1603555 RepID=A0A3G1B7F7_9ARCH|nr:NAD-dependent epimerase/dehydratase family protein [Candidatus Nitrosotenuis cloacae]AJZ76141.1 UDP-glucose 4-epimerase [Candidatus Nitrosotenuis cloacae]
MESFEFNSVLITGGAGFIGSHIAERLTNSGINVKVVDNFVTGKKGNLAKCLSKKNFRLYELDLGNLDDSNEFLSDVDVVFHMAADPEVRTGYDKPEDSFNQNIRNTFNLLQKIRHSKVKKIVFASSSSVYGDATILPTPENYSPLLPISHYGASKLACEALISSFCHNYNMKGIIVRPANVIGSRGRHGLIWDLVHKLKNDNSKLEILGDGKQVKSFIHINDGIEGIFHLIAKVKENVGIFNLGSDDSIEIMTVAKTVCKNMNLQEINIYTTGGIDGGRGWKGDIKKAHLDISKLKNLGWKPKMSSVEAVDLTSREIINEVIQ